MLFKNAFQLLVDNFKLNYKLLLYKAIVAVVTIALAAALLYAPLRGLFISKPMEDLFKLFTDFFGAVTSGNVEFLGGFAEQLQAAVTALIDHLRQNVSNIVLFFTGLIAVTLISRFLDGIGNYTFGCLVDSRLSSYADEPFTVTCIANLGRSALWQVIYVPVTFVYDLLSLALCYLLFLVLLSVITVAFVASVAALMFSVALLLAAQAVKLTIFNDVIPLLVTEKLYRPSTDVKSMLYYLNKSVEYLSSKPEFKRQCSNWSKSYPTIGNYSKADIKDIFIAAQQDALMYINAEKFKINQMFD